MRSPFFCCALTIAFGACTPRSNQQPAIENSGVADDGGVADSGRADASDGSVADASADAASDGGAADASNMEDAGTKIDGGLESGECRINSDCHGPCLHCATPYSAACSGGHCNPCSEKSCGPGQSCTNGTCVQNPCGVQPDCPRNFFTCASSVCTRKSCIMDVDCAEGGFCVNGACFDQIGHCADGC